MLCIHTISILCWVPKRDLEISGNVDLRIGFAQLACQLSNCEHKKIHPDNDWLLQIIKTPGEWHTKSWSLSF